METDNQTNGDKRKNKRIKKGHLRRTRKLLERKLYIMNLIKGINNGVAPATRKILRSVLEMNQKTRKLMIMYKALHPRDNIDILYVSRKNGGRRLASFEDGDDASTARKLHKKAQMKTHYSYQKRY